MSYELTFHPKPTYLHAVVTGENTAENVRAYMADVLRECQARNCARVLIEERLEGPRLPALEVFDLMWLGGDRMQGAFEAIAYVDVVRRGPVMQFAETVGVNRGLPLAVFETVAEAEAWLSKQDEPK